MLLLWVLFPSKCLLSPLPHGLGIAIPAAPLPSCWPSLLPLSSLFSSLPPPIASIIGSWTSSYILLSAEKPPGVFSIWLIAKSWFLIMFLIAEGSRIISIELLKKSGSLNICRNSGLESSKPCISGLVFIAFCMKFGSDSIFWKMGESFMEFIMLDSASGLFCSDCLIWSIIPFPLLLWFPKFKFPLVNGCCIIPSWRPSSGLLAAEVTLDVISEAALVDCCRSCCCIARLLLLTRCKTWRFSLMP